MEATVETPSRGRLRHALDGALALGRRLQPHAPLLVVCLSLVILGCGLRTYHLPLPETITFDEHHFVGNARNYLQGKRDLNDHPPLGKLLIAAGMLAEGDNSLGWRIAPCVLGLVSVALAFALGRMAFGRWMAGWVAAAFVAADGFLICYSRTALLDGMLTTFGLAAATAALRARHPARLLAAAFLAGCAMSIKFSGFALLGAITLVVLTRPGWLRSLLLVPACLATGLAAFTALDVWGRYLTHQPYGLETVYGSTWRLMEAHAAASSFAHPLACHWYTWFLPTKPIVLRHLVGEPGTIEVMTLLGNPLLWWAGSLAGIVSTLWFIWIGPREILARVRAPGAAAPRYFEGFAQLAAFWLSLLMVWMIVPRDSYIYHYLPTYSFGLVLVAGCVTWVYERRAWLALLAVLVVGEVSVFYAPVWAQLPITEAALQQRLFLSRWR
jgi:dolichyl-phosphate-mannose-protein mannosyltransferase